MKYIGVKSKKGFTLVEVTIVVFFMLVLTSITVFNHRKFDSSIELKSQALEIALTIREAQVYALSARSSDKGSVDVTTFRYAYGVFFDKANHNDAYMFYVNKTDNDPATNFWFNDANWDCTTPGGECEKKSDLTAGYTISDLCVDGACNQDDVSVSFKRPDPEAIIRNSNDTVDWDEVVIELSSPKGKTVNIHATKAGQIYVE